MRTRLLVSEQPPASRLIGAAVRAGHGLMALLWLLFASGCASSPETREEQRAAEASIEEILSEPLDAAEYGEARRCLSPGDYRDFEVLDDRRIVFEGRGGRYWLNTLNTRCFDLRNATALRVRSFSAVGRICEFDSFEPADWFEWPWYRRWPWDRRLDSGIRCSLGEFQPISEAQLNAIRAALER